MMIAGSPHICPAAANGFVVIKFVDDVEHFLPP
jgi:hypothetical protein